MEVMKIFWSFSSQTQKSLHHPLHCQHSGVFFIAMHDDDDDIMLTRLLHTSFFHFEPTTTFSSPTNCFPFTTAVRSPTCSPTPSPPPFPSLFLFLCIVPLFQKVQDRAAANKVDFLCFFFCLCLFQAVVVVGEQFYVLLVVFLLLRFTCLPTPSTAWSGSAWASSCSSGSRWASSCCSVSSSCSWWLCSCLRSRADAVWVRGQVARGRGAAVCYIFYPYTLSLFSLSVNSLHFSLFKTYFKTFIFAHAWNSEI